MSNGGKIVNHVNTVNNVNNVYKKSRYYKVCPVCGCTLDPGEKCECEKEQASNE